MTISKLVFAMNISFLDPFHFFFPQPLILKEESLYIGKLGFSEGGKTRGIGGQLEFKI